MVFKMTETEFLDHDTENDGICIACGEIQYGGVEPDATCYVCKTCGMRRVFGMSLALVSGYIDFVEETEEE